MNKRTGIVACLVVPFVAGYVMAQNKDAGVGAKVKKEQPTQRLIIRMDDLGFCHSANMALKRVLENGTCTAVSVIVNTPWLTECVDILKEHPEVSVGVHLTLNCEWREYRWGPVLGADKVPSLVDEFGHFRGSRKEFMKHKPKVTEVEAELRAQIELAKRVGLNISYCDYHMGTAVSTLEFQEVVEKLAGEYGIGVSRYFGEVDAPSVYSVEPSKKLEAAIETIGKLDPSNDLYLLVFHPGVDCPELAAMTDLNPTGVKPMSAHRQAEADVLCSPRFKAAIAKAGLRLVGYDTLKGEGLGKMQRPFVSDPYAEVLDEAVKK